MTSRPQHAATPVRNAAAALVRPVLAAMCAIAGAALFLSFGNSSRGYIDTASLFYWWGFQWTNPGSETEHGWLILGLSVWLLWRNSTTERSAGAPPASDWDGRRDACATVAMLAGLALHALGFAAQQARISIVALLIFSWGVLRLAGGRRWGAAAAFPLAFMMFAIPFNALDSIGFWLRVWVVDASAAIARGAGIAVLQSGTQLTAPDGGYNYDVAAACSGVRSLTAMAALSLLAGYLNFRTWRRRALVLLLCFPLVYLGNVARIVAIIFAAQLGGPKWGDIAHEVMGYGIFVIVLGGVLGGIALLRRWRPEKAQETGRSEDAETRGRGDAETGDRRQETGNGRQETGGGRQRTGDRRQRTGDRRQETGDEGPDTGCATRRVRDNAPYMAAIVVAVAVGEMFFLHHLRTLPPRGGAGVVLAADGRDPVELPAFLGTEWIGRREPISEVEREILPPDTGFSRKRYIALGDPQRPVFLSIVLSGRDRTSIHRPELCLVGQGWTIADQVQHRFRFPGRPDAAFPATLLRVRREIPTPRGKSVLPELTAYWFVGADVVAPSHWRMFVHDAWNRIVRARADRWAYVLMQTDAIDGEAAALARMQAVLDATLPVFQRPQPPPAANRKPHLSNAR